LEKSSRGASLAIFWCIFSIKMAQARVSGGCFVDHEAQNRETYEAQHQNLDKTTTFAAFGMFCVLAAWPIPIGRASIFSKKTIL
jgi:hypothetical protein